jgi:hypothetical protein
MTQVFVLLQQQDQQPISQQSSGKKLYAHYLLTISCYLFPISKQIFEVHDPASKSRDWYGNPPHVLHQNIFRSVPKHSSCCSEEGEAQLLSVSLTLLLVHASLRILQFFG